MKAISRKNNVTLKTIILAYRFASFIKSVPFEVCSTSGQLEIKLFSKWCQLAPWYAANWIIFIYAAFQPYSFTQVLLRDGWTVEASLQIQHLVLYMLGALYLGTLYRKPSEFVQAVNQVYNLIQDHSGSKSWEVRPWYSIPLLSICITYLVFSLIGCVCAETGIYILKPELSRYVFSILPPSMKQNTIVWIMTIALQFMVLLWIYSVLMVAFCYYCAFFFQVIIWLIYMKSSLLRSRRVREWVRLVRFYRKLQVLSAIHNDYGQDFVTGFLVAMGITETLFLYCTLKSYGLQSIFVYWINPAFALFVVILMCLIPPTGTIIHRNDMEFIVTLGCQTGKQLEFVELNREAKSLRIVNTAVSHFCDIGIQCSFVVMNEVLNHLLLLLSF